MNKRLDKCTLFYSNEMQGYLRYVQNARMILPNIKITINVSMALENNVIYRSDFYEITVTNNYLKSYVNRLKRCMFFTFPPEFAIELFVETFKFKICFCNGLFNVLFVESIYFYFHLCRHF